MKFGKSIMVFLHGWHCLRMTGDLHHFLWLNVKKNETRWWNCMTVSMQDWEPSFQSAAATLAPPPPMFVPLLNHNACPLWLCCVAQLPHTQIACRLTCHWMLLQKLCATWESCVQLYVWQNLTTLHDFLSQRAHDNSEQWNHTVG